MNPKDVMGLRLQAVQVVRGTDPAGAFLRRARCLQVLWRAWPEGCLELCLWVRPAESRIDVALLVRPPEAGRAVQATLQAFMPELEWEPMAPADVRPWRAPFPIRDRRVLRRHHRWVTLEAPAHRPNGAPIGFGTLTPRPNGRGRPEGLWVPGRLTPDGVGWDVGAEVLLRQAYPLVVRIQFQPTRLTDGEAEFLRAQALRCEDLATTLTWPTLRDEAQALKEFFSAWLRHLEAAAALGTVTVLAPVPIGPAVLETLGALVGGQVRWDAGPEAPPEAGRLIGLYDPLEGAALWLLPLPGMPAPGLPVRDFRRPGPPRPLGGSHRIGWSYIRGQARPVGLDEAVRRQHVYIVGQTGSGKTTLLTNLALADIRAGRSVVVLDPHGDLFRDLLGRIPEERVQDVVLIDPTDIDFPVGFNVLECADAEERHHIAQEVAEIITRLTEDEYGVRAGEFMGPLFHEHVRMNLLLVMSDPKRPGTLLQFYMIFREDGFWRRWVPLQWDDPLLRRWVEEVLPMQDYISVGSDRISLGDWIASKFHGFVFDPRLRLMFGQSRSTVDLERVLDEDRIVLVNLAKGLLGIANARFLGMVFLAKLYQAFLRRARRPAADRREVAVYVDEFQSLAGQALMHLFSEGRKFGAALTVAHQCLSQVDRRVTEAILGNVGTLIAFRLGPADADRLGPEFAPDLDALDLRNLPNWTAAVRTLQGGRRVRPFIVETERDPTPWDAHRAHQVQQASRCRYGRPRSEVEAAIAESLQ